MLRQGGAVQLADEEFRLLADGRVVEAAKRVRDARPRLVARPWILARAVNVPLNASVHSAKAGIPFFSSQIDASKLPALQPPQSPMAPRATSTGSRQCSSSLMSWPSPVLPSTHTKRAAG